MPTQDGFWPDDLHSLEDRREPAIQLDEEQAIAVCKLETAVRLALQHDQLMPERSILRFKPSGRLER
jgi:hypothetical protein